MGPPSEPSVSTEALLREVSWVQALARRLTKDSASAEDLAQGTLAIALERPPGGNRPLRPWLARVLRNLARGRVRSAARRRTRERSAARAEAIDPESALLERFEEQRRLAALVATLDPELRALVLRRYLGGETPAQIARATGVKPATVRVRLSRALAELRAAHLRELGPDRSRAALALVALPALRPAVSTLLGSSLAMKTATQLSLAAAVLFLGVFGLRLLSAPRGPSDVARAEAPVAPSANSRQRSEPTAATSSQRSIIAPGEPAAPPPGVAASAPQPPAVGLRAVDERGRPIEGARVVFVERNGLPRDLLPSARSGPDGRITAWIPNQATFRFVGENRPLAPLRLEAPGCAASYFVEGVEDGGLEELGDRVLHPGSEVAGRVVDSEGVGVAGAWVVARSPNAKRTLSDDAFDPPAGGETPDEEVPGLRTLSGADGSFELAGLEVGPQLLWYRRVGDPWLCSEPINSLAGGRREGIRLTLTKVAPDERLRGRVVRPDGSPEPRAIVLQRRGTYWEEERVICDDAGRFQLRLPPGTGVDLVATVPSGAFSPSPTVSGQAGGPEVVLALAPARWLEIAVHDEAGTPLERAWILPRVRAAAGRARAVEGDGFDDQGRNHTRTDAQGRANLLAPASPFVVRVGHAACEPLDLELLDPTALPEHIDVELRRRPALEGLVTAHGDPVPEALVLLRSERPSVRVLHKGFPSRLFEEHDSECRTDSAGRFRLPLSDSGRLPKVLLVEAQGWARAEVPLGVLGSVREAGAIEVRLSQGGTVEGVVLVPHGRSALGVVIGCSREDGRPLFTRTDEHGRFTFEHLTPGPWRVEDRASEPEGRTMRMLQPGERPFEPNVVVREGEITGHDIDLRWQADVRLRGRLTIDGALPAGWTAHVEPSGDSDEGAVLPVTEIDTTGYFDTPAAPGPVVLVLGGATGGVRTTVRCELSIGPQTAPFELNLRTATIEGSGLRPGEPLRLVVRHLDAGIDLLQEFSADAGGAFRVQAIADKGVALRQQDRPLTPAEEAELFRPFDLSAGETLVLWSAPGAGGE